MLENPKFSSFMMPLSRVSDSFSELEFLDGVTSSLMTKQLYEGLARERVS